MQRAEQDPLKMRSIIKWPRKNNVVLAGHLPSSVVSCVLLKNIVRTFLAHQTITASHLTVVSAHPHSIQLSSTCKSACTLPAD